MSNCKFVISPTRYFEREVIHVPRKGEHVHLLDEDGNDISFEVREVHWRIFSPWDNARRDSPIDVEIKLKAITQIDH